MSPKIIRPRSIGFRLTAWYAAILTMGLGLFGGLIWLSMRQRLIGEVDEELQGRSSRFESYFKAESVTGFDSLLKDELGEFAQAFPQGSSLEVRGPNGFVFMASRQRPASTSGYCIAVSRPTARVSIWNWACRLSPFCIPCSCFSYCW
jgi:hypothetical protein